MMRSLYSGVSGLKNHQTRMDVIGNNIANVNTSGYKKSRVVFKDTLYQSMRGGSAPVAGSQGGTNPMGIGLGMAVSSIDQIHTGAPAAATGKTMDMAIDGNGYFVVKNGNDTLYTRAGAFDFDKLGQLVNTSNGYRVQGWMASKTDTDWNSENQKVSTDTATLVDINIHSTDANQEFSSIAANATKNMRLSGNLQSSMKIPVTAAGPPPTYIDPVTEFPGANDDVLITSQDVVNSLGEKTTVYFRFFKTGMDATPGTLTNWACDISLNRQFDDPAGGFVAADFAAPVDLTNADATTPAELELLNVSGNEIVRVYNLQFNEAGAIPDPTNSPWFSRVNLTIDPVSTATPATAAADPMIIITDFNKLTQYDSKTTAKVEYQDGYVDGKLSSISVGIDGTITGGYDNGVSKALARVALAGFNNPGGLIQVGGTMFKDSVNAGLDAVPLKPSEGSSGKIIPSSLEMSNVDLSEEFTDMIVTQRGFQANSRIITTSDEMLQELVNLKR
ncbi:MAG: hypothetical protein CVU90_06195 [Firmicutes bacterium HGW-Firmicutes-15]|nr:MAG: hypothetical protein CVU90_06195 [Firmicutes bacterium HGW-Firmicutes-15]